MAARDDVDAVVLVGGQGTRLRPLTLSAPKPMLPTAGVPFLEHMLSRIRARRDHAMSCSGTSYKAETFTEYFGDGSAFGLDIEYVIEDVPLGTGGAIRNVAERLRADTVMVFNGDVLSGLDLTALLGHPPRERRRRHAAPGQGRRSAGVRVGADRAGRPGARRFWRRPTTRRPTRSTPAVTSSGAACWRPSRPAGWSRSSGRRSRGCWPRMPGCSAMSTRPTGSTSARRPRSSAVRPTW